jgi:hypothetical protein
VEPRPAGRGVALDLRGVLRSVECRLGFGRMITSEIEVPNVLTNLL